jgi:hypothetical protein
MIETIARPEHDPMWLALATGKTRDWRPVLAGYASTVDWPGVMIWRELATAYPGAKIILTLRDPEDWYASASATIFARMLEFDSVRGDPSALDPVRRGHMEMINAVVVDNGFGGSLEKSHAIAVFNAHNEAVRRSVPRERLLVCEPGGGWEPLCKFLGVPVPATSYPKVNATQEFHSRFPVKPAGNAS